MMLVMFWPAGTLNWPEAWVYLILQLAMSIFMTIYFLKHDPGLIQKRMEVKVPPKLWDKMVMTPFVIAMISLLIVPGFDVVRYEWSSIPIYLEILGFIGFSIAMYGMFLGMKANPFCIKTVEIQEGHKVASTGVYSYVRHPMYSSAILMMFSIPLALGSVYALICAGVASVLLVVRTVFEDRMLRAELDGYKAYAGRVKWRLLKGVW